VFSGSAQKLIGAQSEAAAHGLKDSTALLNDIDPGNP
jgi:hypothetical protein